MQDNVVRRILQNDEDEEDEEDSSESEGESEGKGESEEGEVEAAPLRRTSSRVTHPTAIAATSAEPAAKPAAAEPAAAKPAAAKPAAAEPAKSARKARDAARALTKRRRQVTPLSSRQIGQSVGAAHTKLAEMLATAQPDPEELRLSAEHLRVALATPGYKPSKKTAGKYKNALASADSLLLQPPVQPAVQPLMQPAVQPLLQPGVQPLVQPADQPLLQPAVQPLMQPAVQTPAQQLAVPDASNLLASPAGDVRAMMKQLRGLKAAQAIPGQEPSALAARAQQMDGLECDIEERERKCRKYGHW